jgi:tRNA threonylcarbamoyl adenosine modification protein YeaZ
MTLLALDTATATASLALYDLDTQQLLAEYTWQARRRHTQELLDAVQSVLAQLGLRPQQLTALAVTTGPGSFTGVRVAISMVKGMGLGLAQRPQVIGLPTLCVTAAPWLTVAAYNQPPALVCAYLQAGRGRYNWAFFPPGDLDWRPAAQDHQGGNAEEFAAALAHHSAPIWLVGEVDANLVQAIGALGQVLLMDEISSWRRAGQLARLAAHHFARGQAEELSALQPLYLRNP